MTQLGALHAHRGHECGATLNSEWLLRLLEFPIYIPPASCLPSINNLNKIRTSPAEPNTSEAEPGAAGNLLPVYTIV